MLYIYILLAIGLFALLVKSLTIVFRDMEGRKRQKLNGLLLIFICMVIFLSMISYESSGSLEKNIFGPLGHYLAKFLINAFGLSSFLLPILLLLAGVGILMNEFVKMFFKVGGFTTGIFFILFITLGYFNVDINVSGVLGRRLGGFIVKWIGISGSIILSIFFLFLFVFLFLERGLAFKIRRRKRTASQPNTASTVKKGRKKRKKKGEVRQKELFTDEVLKVNGDFRDRFLSILSEPIKGERVSPALLKTKASLLEEKLKDMGIEGKVINTILGPVITRFEYKPSPGVKVSKIASLADDLAMALRAEKLRILAPIPGKEVVGIEIPNNNREIVYLKELLLDERFQKNPSMLYIPIGKDITGRPYFSDIGEMPHLLVAGVTGSGKSVFLNSLIASILYKATVNDVRFIMIDPKRIELSIYNGIPHLLFPAITESEEAVKVLKAAELLMERRYMDLSRVGVRDIYAYNRKVQDKMPFILVVIDELADLLLQMGREVERVLIRLAQKARAVGIHLVLATQRPSVDVITGLIKANFPSRIAFQVPSRNDARTIMDTIGAEKLLGKGDMLFMPPKGASPIRLHGPYISTEEAESIVKLIGGSYIENIFRGRFENWKEIVKLIIEEDMLFPISAPHSPGARERLEVFARFLKKEAGIDEDDFLYYVDELNFYPVLEEFELSLTQSGIKGEISDLDPLIREAAGIVVQYQSGSASLLQRKLKIGFNRAGRLMDQLEAIGVVGPSQGSKPREVLVKRLEDLDDKFMEISK